MPYEQDTIAAIATPFGESGIGVVRVSGPLAEPISQKIFKPKNERPELSPRTFYYGEVIDPRNGSPVDEVLLVLMRAPKTYTREDVLEIQCHGGYVILQKILETVLREGVRIAEPGEFTRRAFLNGRIDLTQAEAVIDLIRAKTMAGVELANQQLRGALKSEISRVKEEVVERLALIEAHIDFPEEEIDAISAEVVRKNLQDVLRRIEIWIASFEEGRIFREGISCAIVGKTNVGKSSLLNVLLMEDRAIVTPIPGTTRDVIEEVLNIREIPVRLMDTAGLRRTEDSIEIEGVRRTRERIADSDFVILMIDGSRVLDREDRKILGELEGKKKVVVVNKMDLGLRVSIENIRREFREDAVVPISALKNEGIEGLKDAMYRCLVEKESRASPEHLIVANVRHRDALVRAKESIRNGLKGMQEGLPLEFVAFDLRSALEALGEIVGETTSEEILNRIFEQFCIGK